MSTAIRRWRDIFKSYTPVWLSERPGQFTGATVGYRLLWTLHAWLDYLTQAMIEGLLSWFPGLGTVTALPLIGATRGIRRGQSDTDADYVLRLQGYRDRWGKAGSRYQIARALHEYLPGRPQVDVLARVDGFQQATWTRVDANGVRTEYRNVPWAWDTAAAGTAATDVWIIVQDPYAHRAGTVADFASSDTPTRSLYGIGQIVSRADVDAVIAEAVQWKSAPAHIKAIIWCSDPTLFNPLVPSTLPADGNWGTWGYNAGLPAGFVPSSRNVTSCRYWEPQ